eukprot:551913-Prymnesium_polylepis.2
MVQVRSHCPVCCGLISHPSPPLPPSPPAWPPFWPLPVGFRGAHTVEDIRRELKHPPPDGKIMIRLATGSRHKLGGGP